MAHQAAQANTRPLNIPDDDDKLADLHYFFKAAADSPEMKDLQEVPRKARLDSGSVQHSGEKSTKLEAPKPSRSRPLTDPTAEGARSPRDAVLEPAHGAGERDKGIGKTSCLFVTTSRATFGMRYCYRQSAFIRRLGQRYEPEDSESADVLQEDKHGQISRRNKRGGRAVLVDGGGHLGTRTNMRLIPFLNSSICSGCNAWAISSGRRATCEPAVL